jgi:hypothetical protein
LLASSPITLIAPRSGRRAAFMSYDYARDEEIASGRSTMAPHFVATGHSRSQNGVGGPC